MKHSIRRQFAMVFIGLMACTIFLCWTINNMFLEQYYVLSRKNVILDAYSTISHAVSSDTYNTDEFRQKLDNEAPDGLWAFCNSTL